MSGGAPDVRCASAGRSENAIGEARPIFDTDVVAKRLGHKDPSVTLDVYADVVPDDDGKAVHVIMKAVWGGA